jgi:hypothetical protein
MCENRLDFFFFLKGGLQESSLILDFFQEKKIGFQAWQLLAIRE